MHIRRIRVKKRTNDFLFLKRKQTQNKVNNILKNKIEQIEKSIDLLQNILAQVKKKKGIIWKRTEENSKNSETFTK